MKLLVRAKGSASSGYYGHEGREGIVGGSAARGSGSAVPSPEGSNYRTWPNSKDVFGANPLLDSRAMRLKEEVAKSLEDVLPREQASTFIHQWAESSNDTDYRSLSIQEDAAREFGVDLSDWQKGKLEEYHRHMAAAKEIEGLNAEYVRLKKVVERPKLPPLESIEGISAEDMQDYNRGVSTYEDIMDKYPKLQSSVHKRYRKNQADYEDVRTRIETLHTELEGSSYVSVREYADGFRINYSTESKRLQPPEVQQQALRTMYENTQKFFRDQGITEVLMYRRISIPVKNRPKQGDIVRVKGNAIESWTGDPNISPTFGSVMLAMKIPVERILSTPMTGFGCLHEFEYVILGGVEDECRAVVSSSRLGVE